MSDWDEALPGFEEDEAIIPSIEDNTFVSTEQDTAEQQAEDEATAQAYLTSLEQDAAAYDQANMTEAEQQKQTITEFLASLEQDDAPPVQNEEDMADAPGPKPLVMGGFVFEDDSESEPDDDDDVENLMSQMASLAT